MFGTVQPGKAMTVKEMGTVVLRGGGPFPQGSGDLLNFALGSCIQQFRHLAGNRSAISLGRGQEHAVKLVQQKVANRVSCWNLRQYATGKTGFQFFDIT